MHRAILEAFIPASNFTIWFDTVPLSIMRGQFPSLAISRERTPILFPLQNGNGWTLQCQTTVGRLLSISWPMIPGLINPKRIISTNNCRLANRQLSSRDGTYVYQCHANLTVFISIIFNLIINIMNHYQFLHYLNLNYSTYSLNLTINISHISYQNKHQPE